MLPQMEYNGQLFIDGWAIHCVIFHNDPGFLYHQPGGVFEKKTESIIHFRWRVDGEIQPVLKSIVALQRVTYRIADA